MDEDEELLQEIKILSLVDRLTSAIDSKTSPYWKAPVYPPHVKKGTGKYIRKKMRKEERKREEELWQIVFSLIRFMIDRRKKREASSIKILAKRINHE